MRSIGEPVRLSEETINERLAQAEPLVRYFARTCKLIGMDQHDVRQELRIHAWRLVYRYDENRGAKWTTFVANSLRFRAMDLSRRWGVLTQSGNVRPDILSLSPIVEDPNGLFKNSGSSIVDEACCPSDRLADVDWRDLSERCECETKAVRALLLQCEGLQGLEIAARLQSSEAWISTLLSPRHHHLRGARERLKELYFGD